MDSREHALTKGELRTCTEGGADIYNQRRSDMYPLVREANRNLGKEGKPRPVFNPEGVQ